MSAWQSIETAPKDGTHVLVYYDGAWTHQTVAHWESMLWRLSANGAHAEDDDVFPQPTHWMPLPDPPKDGE